MLVFQMAHRLRFQRHNNDCLPTNNDFSHEIPDDVTIERAWGSVDAGLQTHNEQVQQDTGINAKPNTEVQYQSGLHLAHAQEVQSPYTNNTGNEFQASNGDSGQQYGTSVSSHNHIESLTYFSRHYARSYSQWTRPTTLRQPDMTHGSTSSIGSEVDALIPSRRMGICDANDHAYQLRRRMRVYKKRF